MTLRLPKIKQDEWHDTIQTFTAKYFKVFPYR